MRVPQQNGPHVAIVGAGFSGLLTAVNLLKASRDVRVTLIERRGVFGPGTAYDTGNPGHLLNVRLDNMSAFPCLLYTSPSPRDLSTSRMPSSA